MRARYGVIILGIVLGFAAAACAVYDDRMESKDPTKVSRKGKPVDIRSPTKAHLKDGAVVLFQAGFRLQDETLLGKGEHYDITRTTRTPVDKVALEEVAQLEYYNRKLEPIQSSVGTAAGVMGAAFLVKAVFGSCPTVYSLSADSPQLEAELFSHSIAPIFEGEDLDRIEQRDTSDERYALRVTNEALETHYIDRLTLLAVEHPQGYEAFPTPARGVALFGRAANLLEARDRSGHDALAQLSARDGATWHSDPALTHKLTREVGEDWIDVKVRVPRGADSLTVALRARNTLFATVLLYDVVLRAQGVRAIDWIGEDVGNPLYAWRLHRWFEGRFGLRVQLRRGTAFRQVARVTPTGPIAWHQIAVRVPLEPGAQEATLRLAFLPDNWIIDWVGVSFDGASDTQMRRIAPQSVTDARGTVATASARALGKDDGDYFVTRPGEHYEVGFALGPRPDAGRERTLFIASRGYYIEWVRGEWVSDRGSLATNERFEPGDAAIMKTARRWIAEKPQLERQFFESRVRLAGSP